MQNKSEIESDCFLNQLMNSDMTQSVTVYDKRTFRQNTYILIAPHQKKVIL